MISSDQNQNVIDQLEAALKKARESESESEILAVAVVLVSDDGEVSTSFSAPGPYVFNLLGAVGLVRAKIERAQLEENRS